MIDTFSITTGKATFVIGRNGDASTAIGTGSTLKSPKLHRRLRRPHHYGCRRGRLSPAVAGEARGDPPRRPVRHPDGPARLRDRGPHRRWYERNTSNAV